MGVLDAQGIHIYDETDERDEFSTLLNVGQQATSDAILADRSRLTALETASELEAVTGAGIFTAASGWSIVNQTGRKKNGLAFVRVQVSRTGGTITIPSDGDVANQLLATISPGWEAAAGMDYIAAAASVGRVASALIRPGTGLQMGATVPGTNITNGDEFSFAAVYPLA